MSKEMEKFLEKMDKQFGERSLVEFGADVATVEALPTGIASLDYKLGVGGFPRGRIIEIYGPEGAGKTTVAIKFMAECQKRAGTMPKIVGNIDLPDMKPTTGRVGFLDVEHAFNPQIAVMHGMKIGEGSGFFFDQPMSGVEAMQKLEMMVDSNLFDVIVVDSVAGLTTDDEEKKDIGSQVMAGTAQLMSATLKKLTSRISASRTVVIFINQIRDKPAVMFGSPETTSGGRALKFYSSVRMRVARAESHMDGTVQYGHKMKIKINKNKVAPPFETVEIDLYYRDSAKKKAGFDGWSDAIQLSRDLGIVDLNGSSYKYVNAETGEVHKAQGIVKWKQYLEDNPEVYESIVAEMYAPPVTNDKEEIADDKDSKPKKQK